MLIVHLLAALWPFPGGVAAATTIVANTNPSQFLNFSSSAPYIFSSLNGLLQQWSNTFFPNGHTLTSCEVPKSTLLYHGRHDLNDPPSPEWLAFDIEMSYGIMGNLQTSRMLTYRTTRAVKCLYFDGTSATLMGAGTESQMTFLYGDSESVPDRGGFPGGGGGGGGGGGPPGRGRPPPGDGRGPPGRGPPPDDRYGRFGSSEDGERWARFETAKDRGRPDDEPRRWNPLADEYFRARGLCNWIEERGLGGSGWGYEGIVRMNAGFEMIWCNFNSSSLQLMSNLDVSAPLLDVAVDDDSDDGDGNNLASSHPLASRTSRSQQPLLHANDESPHGPNMADPREPFRKVSNYMWFTGAARRYGSMGNGVVGAGETRVKIDTCGLFSFYDTGLSGQSIARIRDEQRAYNITADGRWTGPPDGGERYAALEHLSRRRRSHRTNNVTKADGRLMYERVATGLRDALNATACSGIRWDAIAHEITTFYSKNLNYLRSILITQLKEPDTDIGSLRAWLEQVRILTHWFILPFFEYPKPPSASLSKSYTKAFLHEHYAFESENAQAAIERCTAQYTPSRHDLARLNSSNERTLFHAINETLSGLCASLFRIGLGVEREWLAHYNTQPSSSSAFAQSSASTLSASTTGSIASFTFHRQARRWLRELEELMAWLGWVDQWTACDKPCGVNETCYIPMWPVGEGWGRGRGPEGEVALWEPTCVSTVNYPG